MKLDKRINAVGLLLVSIGIGLTLAKSSYLDLIPNGKNVSDPCNPGQIWKAVGHWDKSNGGRGTLNKFAIDFAAAGYNWTKVCSKDSDGDGNSNGKELGDPGCKWRNKSSPVSKPTGHPGIPEPLDKYQTNNSAYFNVNNCPQLKVLLSKKNNNSRNNVNNNSTSRGLPNRPPRGPQGGNSRTNAPSRSLPGGADNGGNQWSDVQKGCACYCIKEEPNQPDGGSGDGGSGMDPNNNWDPNSDPNSEVARRRGRRDTQQGNNSNSQRDLHGGGGQRRGGGGGGGGGGGWGGDDDNSWSNWMPGGGSSWMPGGGSNWGPGGGSNWGPGGGSWGPGGGGGGGGRGGRDGGDRRPGRPGGDDGNDCPMPPPPPPDLNSPEFSDSTYQVQHQCICACPVTP